MDWQGTKIPSIIGSVPESTATRSEPDVRRRNRASVDVPEVLGIKRKLLASGLYDDRSY